MKFFAYKLTAFSPIFSGPFGHPKLVSYVVRRILRVKHLSVMAISREISSIDCRVNVNLILI